jgi:hypothetical protein
LWIFGRFFLYNFQLVYFVAECSGPVAVWWSKTSNSAVLFCLLTNDCLGSAKDEKEVALCIEELNAPSFYPSVVSLWINDSFERKDMERELLGKLFVSLCSGRHNLLSKQQLIDGLVLFALFSFLVTKYLTTLDGTPKHKSNCGNGVQHLLTA